MKTWVLLGVLACFSQIEACTAFQLKAKDGAQIYCRSMEFGFALHSDLLIVPRQTAFTGTAPNGKPGIKWKNQYGYVGMNQWIAKKLVCDGMNEKGLVVGMLYLPGYAQYEPPDDARKTQTLGPWEVGSYLLGTCSTVEEAKAALSKVVVAQEPFPGMKDFVLPLHFYIGDKNGKVLIVEYIKGKRQEYDNPLGVLTNSPPFDWHLANLGNFVNLSSINVPEVELSNFEVPSLGQGSGMLGLPGDYTPPSRFIKAAFFSKWATEQKTAEETVRLGFHVLNTFDIFQGIIKETSKQNPAKVKNSDTTEWVIVHDRTNLRTYFRSYNSLRIQMVDLKKIDFLAKELRIAELSKEFQVEDETNKLKSFK